MIEVIPVLVIHFSPFPNGKGLVEVGDIVRGPVALGLQNLGNVFGCNMTRELLMSAIRG